MLTCQQDQRYHILYDERTKARERSKKHNGLITSFGHVLGVCAVGNTIEEAHKSVYELVEQIHFVRKNMS
jgi:phosphoribosylamine-glycine ligase